MRRASTWLVGLALAIFVLGASVVPLTIPAFTRIVAAKTSQSSEAGLSQARTLEVAEQVRRFVVDRSSPPLPAMVDGREGFDDSAVSHLVDVRGVLSAARVASGLLAVVLSLGLAFEVTRKRTDRIADVLLAGAACCLGLVALSVVAAVSDFDAFFSAFHGLFFSDGTWTFPYDSLLIRVFPEAFWVSAGATWGALVLAGAGVLAASGWTLRRVSTRSES